jgi:MFS family permease
MFLILRAQSVGIAAAHAPLLGLVFNLTYTLASWPAGKLSDRAAPADGASASAWRYLMAAAGFIVFAIVYWVFASAPSRTALWAMMAFYGLYYALTNPVLRALVAETAPAEARGRAFGIYYFVTSVAALLSSVITGELWKHYGPRLPLNMSALLAVIAAAMLFGMRPLLRRHERRRPSPLREEPWRQA